jgi:hypothetical protein
MFKEQSSKANDLAQEILSQQKDSAFFMRNSYYDEWIQSYKNYKCKVEERKDADGKIDAEKTHIGMPDTWSLVNRRTARITANIPKIGFTSHKRDPEVNKFVSRKLMSDWDRSGMQVEQKRHVRQTEMLGWSVRSWWWELDEFDRNRRIDVTVPLLEEDLRLIASTYNVTDPKLLLQQDVLNQLLRQFGRGGLLPVSYTYKAFEGPRSKVLFVGDCYPEPYFEDIQNSGWFIVERRRNRQWLDSLAKRYPEMQKAVELLLTRYPKGTDGSTRGGEIVHLRDEFRKAVCVQTEQSQSSESRQGTGLWTIVERHIPGRKPRLGYVAEEGIWLGEIPYPFDLDGKIPFTDLTLIDDLFGGVGDSVARIIQGIQWAHNLTVNSRFDIMRHITNPILGTSDRVFYDNPDMLKRDLYRIFFSRTGQGAIWNLNDQPSLASALATLNEESNQMRMIQMASGDSNMSMSANVDPAQLRTATGAKILQGNTDVLTADLVSMFNLRSVNRDVEMMYLMNRSEMADAVEIDASPYDRNYEPNRSPEREDWIRIEPRHFQVDGQLTVELGSTLADDDEINVQKAMSAFQMFTGNPHVNQVTLVRDCLVALGKGAQIADYMVDQPAAPPPPTRSAMSFSVPFETLSPALQLAVLQSGGIAAEAIAQAQQEIDAQPAFEQPLAQPAPEEMPPDAVQSPA